MKIRLKSGDKEIEIEGTKSEIDGALANWWNPSITEKPGNDKVNATRGTKTKIKGIKTKIKSEADEDGGESNFDPVAQANLIKEHENYGLYEDYVLHKSNLINKILLICAHTSDALTSGEITKALLALDVKVDQGNLSNALKTHSGRFLATNARKKGGVKPKYRLTSKARTDFNEWISKQASA